MRAGLAKPDAAQRDRADGELAPDEVVERDAARHDIAAARAGRELDAVLTLQRFERFAFDQRRLGARIALGLGISPAAGEIAVAVEPLSRHGAHFRDLPDRCAAG